MQKYFSSCQELRNKVLVIISFFLIFSFLLFSLQAKAQTLNGRISIIVPNDASQYMQVVKSIKSRLSRNYKSASINIINLSNFQQNYNTDLNNEKLVIVLGSKSLDFYLKKKAKSPYIASLITKSAFEYITKSYKNRNGFIGGITIDQPENRYIRLAQAILPKLRMAALVFGPEKLKNKNSIFQKINYKNDRIKYDIVDISLNDNPVNKLRTAFELNQALILFPDRKTFNRSLSRWVLTLSYQYKIPVISYSKKYAKAGALASLFSTSEQIGIQTAEMAIPYLKNSDYKLKKLVDPKYFDIEINQSVANALNIKVPAKSVLMKKISN